MKHGFSLVELSIVLVILGLLTGGILAGQNLIRAAEMRSVSTEYQSYVTATQTFRDKYFAIPGDIRNATAFWGSSSSCPGTAGTGTQTCNGNGDGFLDGAPAANNYGEDFMYWQHLANAGLIEGSFTGRAGSLNAGDADIRANVPPSKFGQGGWTAADLSNFAGHAFAFAYDYGNNLRIGTENPSGGGTGQPLFTPEEAWNIDTKMDDGLPAAGKIIASHWDDECTQAVTGTASQTNLDAEYRVQDSTPWCVLFFIKVF